MQVYCQSRLKFVRYGRNHGKRPNTQRFFISVIDFSRFNNAPALLGTTRTSGTKDNVDAKAQPLPAKAEQVSASQSGESVHRAMRLNSCRRSLTGCAINPSSIKPVWPN